MYLFPEPTILITGSFYSQGKETTFEIGSENYGPNDFISWFYDLELTACDEPEAVEGAESYTFKAFASNRICMYGTNLSTMLTFILECKLKI